MRTGGSCAGMYTCIFRICYSSFDRLKWCQQFCEYVPSRLYGRDGGYCFMIQRTCDSWIVITWARFINCWCGIGWAIVEKTLVCNYWLNKGRQLCLNIARFGSKTSHYTQQVSHFSYCRKKGTCGGGQRGRRHDILLHAYLECLSSSLFRRGGRKE